MLPCAHSTDETRLGKAEGFAQQMATAGSGCLQFRTSRPRPAPAREQRDGQLGVCVCSLGTWSLANGSRAPGKGASGIPAAPCLNRGPESLLCSQQIRDLCGQWPHTFLELNLQDVRAVGGFGRVLRLCVEAWRCLVLTKRQPEVTAGGIQDTPAPQAGW